MINSVEKIINEGLKSIVNDSCQILKQNCSTYADLETNLKMVKKNMLWNNSNLNKSIFELLQIEINNEKNRLPISKDNPS